ncbi:MAG: helix-turn-helix domain-containing protein [Acidimicrobiia bacterium]
MHLMPGPATRLPEMISLAGAVRTAGGVRAVELANGQVVPLSENTARLIEAVLDGDAKVSPEEAARLLGVSRPMVVRWIEEGLLVDEPVGTHHRIPVSSVLLLREARREAGRSTIELAATADKGDEAAITRMEAAERRASARIARR